MTNKEIFTGPRFTSVSENSLEKIIDTFDFPISETFLETVFGEKCYFLTKISKTLMFRDIRCVSQEDKMIYENFNVSQNDDVSTRGQEGLRPNLNLMTPGNRG